MIREVDITNLEKGFIDEEGSYSTSSEYIRTSSRLTYDGAFLKLHLPFHAIKNLPVSGSFDGTTGYRYNTPAGTTLASYTKNANYKVIYYWAFIYRTNPETGVVTTPYIGHFMIRIPVDIGNFVGDPAYIARKNVPQNNSEANSDLDKYLVGTSEDYDSLTPDSTITYYSSGTSGDTVTKTAKEFVFGSRYNEGTDRVEFVLKGERGSEMARCKAGIIIYSNSGATGGQVIHSERWIDVPTSEPIYVLPYAPVAKMLMVFQIVDVSIPAVNELVNPKLKYVDDGWELNEDDILLNSGLPEKVDTPTFVPPYPATMWYLDENNKLLNGLLPEPYEEKHDIVHDDIGGKEYFNQHSNAYDSALSNLNNNYRIRLEILTDEETVIGEITKDLSLTAAGQITINYEQITRRSCSLSLINVDNKYIPTKNSPFWLNRKFKLWLGLVVGKDTYWWSQGIFYTVSANATGRILSIEGVDKGGALDGTLKLNMTEAQYQFKRGKALTEMIKQTLALDVGNPYGSKNSPIGFGGNRPIDSQPPLIGIEYYGFNTVADISIDANSYISEMFVNMAELYAADCYYNTNGNLVFEQHIDSSGYNYVPTQWSFTDLSSTFEDVNYEYSYEGENVVTVYTNTTEAGVRNVAWTAYNTNPLSPLNVATGIRRAPHIEIPYYNHIDEVALAQAQADLKEIETEMKTKGIDAAVTVYGNIDCNNRQVIYWGEANLERFEEAYESWDYTAEELAGSISTVMGTSSEYDGVEIAYSPILQTDDGAVLLDANTVDEYIWGLIDNAGSGWNKDTLLNLDRTGLEFDGVLIKNLIADVGATAIKTGESMHYVGKYGALQLAKDEIYAIQNANEVQQIKDCRSTANHYLLANSMLGMTLNFNSPIIPHMDVNKSISISDQYADIEDGIYVIQSITIPLSSNKMQISATNINWLPNDMTFGGVSEIVENNQNGGAET